MTLQGSGARRLWGARALIALGALVFASSAVAAPWDTDWTLRAELTASDGAAGDYLGRSVSLDGDIAVVGAAGSDVGGAESQGAAYVYVRSGDTWTQQTKLTAPDGVAGDEFGFAAAISGDTIVVGARFAAIDGINGHGVAYVFVRSGDTWIQQAKLAADDGAASDRFALSVKVSGDTAIFGSPSAAIGANGYQGAAYVFTRNAGAWSFQTKLTASDGAAFDEFGVSVALEADTILVGAHYADVVFSGQGAAYAFVRNGDAWSEQGKLVSDDAFFGDEFGISVAISGDTAAVGALFADAGGTENEGEAYIFSRVGGAWSQAAKLFPDTATMGGEFGIGVALEGDTVVVGAESAPVDGEFRGAAYVFSSASATPLPAAQVTPSTLTFTLAPGASDAQAIEIANVGDAGSTLAFSIYEAADATCGAPVDASWLDAVPIDGSVDAGASQEVQVTADASALGDGDYTAWLCVSTSDPVQAFVPVSVTLSVTGTNPDWIFANGFESP